VRKPFRAWLIGATCVASIVSILGSTGCSTAPTCNVSPVEIEELREDVAAVEKNLAAARERSDALNKELAAKQADLESKKGKPEELRARLAELKKGSGRMEKPKADEKSKASTSGDKKGASQQ
jgi:chromosome segregation ATPase